MANFLPEEWDVAERLLANFAYFNERMTDSLLEASVNNFFTTIGQDSGNADILYNDLLPKTAFVICEGEKPNPTDSGHIFARKLRDRLGVPETQIFRPGDALSKMEIFHRFVFVDDFTGSGNQFIETWNGNHIFNGTSYSFNDFAQRADRSFAYCCCIAAKAAETAILKNAPTVRLFPAHQLEDRHNVTHPESSVWAGFDAEAARRTIQIASARAGYAAEDHSEDDWRGFHALGLALAFNHGIPDACLPIFFSQRNGWKPLIERS